MITKTYEIKAEEGLHARPASFLAKVANKYKCEIKMFRPGEGNKKYQPKSILSIMTMAAAKGDLITFEADGADAEAALEEIRLVLETDFQG